MEENETTQETENKPAENIWNNTIEIEDLGNLKKKITIKYNKVGVDGMIEKAIEIVRKEATIAGFRKGKAPKGMVERKFQDKIDDIGKSLMAQEGFARACYENKISILEEPKINGDSGIEIDGTFCCEIEVLTKPNFTPSGYIGLKLTKPNFNKENMINCALEDIKKKYMNEAEIDELKDGGVAEISYDAFVEGKTIASAQKQQFNITTQQGLPFGSNLIGMKKGETKLEKYNLTDGEFKDKEVQVQITLDRVLEKIMPTTEELVEKLKINSIEEMMAQIGQNVDMDIQQKERQAYEEAIVDSLLETHQYEVPEKWVTQEAEYFTQQLGGTQDENAKEYIKKMAERNVKRSFLLNEIIQLENIKVSQEEWNQLLEHEAQRMKISKLILEDKIKKNGQANSIIEKIRQEKLMMYLIQNATIEEEKDSILTQLDNI